MIEIVTKMLNKKCWLQNIQMGVNLRKVLFSGESKDEKITDSSLRLEKRTGHSEINNIPSFQIDMFAEHRVHDSILQSGKIYDNSVCHFRHMKVSFDNSCESLRNLLELALRHVSCEIKSRTFQSIYFAGRERDTTPGNRENPVQSIYSLILGENSPCEGTNQPASALL